MSGRVHRQPTNRGKSEAGFDPADESQRADLTNGTSAIDRSGLRLREEHGPDVLLKEAATDSLLSG